MKAIVTLFTAILLTACNSKTNTNTTNQYPEIQFDKTEHNFGNITQGDKVSTTFQITNTGNADLVIINAIGSCGCTIPQTPKEPIPPKQKVTMKVEFNSAGKFGLQEKTVTLTTNTKQTIEKLTIKANIKPKL